MQKERNRKLPIKLKDEEYRWDDAIIRDINVYEDISLKNRAIGFIWPDEKRIITK
jgi:hypothetical protein